MKTILTLSIICFCLVACDRPNCTNQNPIFDSYEIESKEYKNELAKDINRLDASNLTYWFNDYLEKDGKEYIIVNIQNDELCAKGIIEVKDWTKIEGIKKSKGVSYRGAELVGLTFEVNEFEGNSNFIYKTLDHILD